MRHTWPLALRRFAGSGPNHKHALGSALTKRVFPILGSTDFALRHIHSAKFVSSYATTSLMSGSYFPVVHEKPHFGTSRCLRVGAVHCIISGRRSILATQLFFARARKISIPSTSRMIRSIMIISALEKSEWDSSSFSARMPVVISTV